jgi:hypothetical protein
VLLRVALGAAAAALCALVLVGVVVKRSTSPGLWSEARSNRVGWLLVTATALATVRVLGVPRVEPIGYWPRWEFVGALTAYSAALLRLYPRGGRRWTLFARLGRGVVAASVWFALVSGGIWLTWYHRPLERLREVVPGRIFISAMPTGRGLEVAHGRHRFKTVINLFPEDTPLRSSRLPEELAFVRRRGLTYVASPSDVVSSDDFLDRTLRLACDPGSWPILVHCHGCMDRTPAWVGIYQFVVEGKPLEQSLRFIEQHRGYRPKASVTLLYNRVLPRLAGDRAFSDPTAALLRESAARIVDPYYEQLEGELGRRAVGREPGGRPGGLPRRASLFPPSLTPRR